MLSSSSSIALPCFSLRVFPSASASASAYLFHHHLSHYLVVSLRVLPSLGYLFRQQCYYSHGFKGTLEALCPHPHRLLLFAEVVVPLSSFFFLSTPAPTSKQQMAKFCFRFFVLYDSCMSSYTLVHTILVYLSSNTCSEDFQKRAYHPCILCIHLI